MTTQIKQRTPEWFAARKGKITGSKIGAILGLSQYSTPEDIMKEMILEWRGHPSQFNGNIATNYGTANETAAIMDFFLLTGLYVDQTGMHTSKDLSYIAASPDGLIGMDGLLEIKCPYSKREATTGEEFISVYDQMHYYAQVQYELYCTNRLKCYFFQWAPSANKLEMVGIDREFIRITLPKLQEFYHEFVERRDRKYSPVCSAYVGNEQPYVVIPAREVMRNVSEDQEMKEFFRVLRREKPELGKVALHIKNEGVRDNKQIAFDRSRGLVKGAPDIMIAGCPSLLIEMKRTYRPASITEEQKAYLFNAKKLGSMTFVCYGYKAALEAVEIWEKVIAQNNNKQSKE